VPSTSLNGENATDLTLLEYPVSHGATIALPVASSSYLDGVHLYWDATYATMERVYWSPLSMPASAFSPSGPLTTVFI
jgi:hypothetical protein